jgi:hypothetical protein
VAAAVFYFAAEKLASVGVNNAATGVCLLALPFSGSARLAAATYYAVTGFKGVVNEAVNKNVVPALIKLVGSLSAYAVTTSAGQQLCHKALCVFNSEVPKNNN